MRDIAWNGHMDARGSLVGSDGVQRRRTVSAAASSTSIYNRSTTNTSTYSTLLYSDSRFMSQHQVNY